MHPDIITDSFQTTNSIFHAGCLNPVDAAVPQPSSGEYAEIDQPQVTTPIALGNLQSHDVRPDIVNPLLTTCSPSIKT